MTVNAADLQREHEQAAASIADRPTACQSRSNQGNNQLRSLAERTACHGNNQLRLQCGGWLTPASVAVNAADLQLPSVPLSRTGRGARLSYVALRRLVVTALECEHERAAASIADRPTVCQSRSNEGNSQLQSHAAAAAYLRQWQ